MRRFTPEVMCCLDAAGIDCVLIDLPGTNENRAPLEAQSLKGWRSAVAGAMQDFHTAHLLAIRGGCLLAPEVAPGWFYAPAKGGSILRQMSRAHTLSSKEAGREESREGLTTLALTQGIKLAGFHIGPQLLADLEHAEAASGNGQSVIGQAILGGAGLWLRAEPGESREQADALAAIISVGMRG